MLAQVTNGLAHLGADIIALGTFWAATRIQVSYSNCWE